MDTIIFGTAPSLMQMDQVVLSGSLESSTGRQAASIL